MAIQYLIQNTFLTLKQGPCHLRRTQSWGGPILEMESKTCVRKVHSFPVTVATPSKDCEVDTPTTAASAKECHFFTSAKQKCISKTCKPCVNFMFGECKFGDECLNCHEPHTANNRLMKLYRWKMRREEARRS